MRIRVWYMVISTSLVLGALTPEVMGDSAKKIGQGRSAKDQVHAMFPVDSMMRQAADNVSRRYNLNAEQTQFTHDMMVKRVARFLEEHEDEVWPVIRDMARHQNPNRKMDPRTARRLGKAIQPIFAEARKAILEANEEWRDILSNDQKKLHDYDLKEMGKTFGEMDNRFDGWAKGRADRQRGIFPEPRPDNPPVNPKMPKVNEASAERVIRAREEWWNGYVENFIKNYELDEGQITAARSILKEVKERALAYRTVHKEDFEKVAKKREAARKANDLEKINQAMAEERQLNKYIPKLFKELKERLDKIPRPAQQEKYESKEKEFRWADRSGGEPDAFKTGPKAASSAKTSKAEASEEKPDAASTTKAPEPKSKKEISKAESVEK